MEKLKPDVQMYPDAYQDERTERFGVSQTGIGAALRRLGISRKKNLSHPKADIAARCAFKEKITAYQEAHQPLVYLDESGFALDMPRRKCYARWENIALANKTGMPIMITSEHHKPVVIMSLEDFNTWQETAYLMQSPANAKDLLEAVIDVETRRNLVKQDRIEET